MDRRLEVSVCAAVIALGAGVAAVVTGTPALGVAAGAAGVVAGIAAAAIAARAKTSEVQLDSAREQVQRLHREVDTLAGALAEEASLRSARLALADDDELPLGSGNARPDKVLDHVSGLLHERFFDVLVEQRVAAARRQLQPVSVVLFEVDGLSTAKDTVQDEALGVLGEVVRHTLRESDSACRIGDLMAGAVLEDTTEAGAVWAAERVRGNLLGSPVGSELTISAGIACYPSHALGSEELITMATRALETARSHGYDHVEIAPTE